MKYPLLLLTLLLVLSSKIFAQTVTGTITTEQGLPLAHVTVSEASSDRSSMSDSLGNYAIDLSEGTTRLKFSTVGFAEKEVEIDNRTNINVVLQEDYVNLNEVVVIGYGSVNKKDLTGAVSTLS